MFKFFTNLSSIIIIVGIILFASSFFVNVSIWYGIELVRGGVFLFVIGMFLQLVNQGHINKENIQQ